MPDPFLPKDPTRESWGRLWLERIWQDARYALRQIRKSRAFAAAVIGTLALGIAAATTMFTVVDHVLFRPLPYPHASRLVRIFEGTRGYALVPRLDVAAWQSQSHSFDGIAAYDFDTGRSFLGNGSTSSHASLLYVGPDFFKVLGVQPQFGPGLPTSPSADTRTAVLSDTAWRTIFATDPNIIGSPTWSASARTKWACASH